jgi:hypothetical protein
MTENTDAADGSPDRGATPPEQPAAEPTSAAPLSGPAVAAPVLKTRWRDRAWSFRALLAVALATLIIGGVGGLVVGAAAARHHDRHDGFYHRLGPGGGPGMGPGWRMRGGPGWRWDDGNGQPFGGPGTAQPTPSTPSPTAPGTTG